MKAVLGSKESLECVLISASPKTLAELKEKRLTCNTEIAQAIEDGFITLSDGSGGLWGLVIKVSRSA